MLTASSVFQGGIGSKRRLKSNDLQIGGRQLHPVATVNDTASEAGEHRQALGAWGGPLSMWAAPGGMSFCALAAEWSERLAPRRRRQHRNPGPCPWRRPDGSEGATGPTHAGAGTPNAGTTTVPPAPPVRSGLRSRPAYLNRWPTASHQAEPSGHPGLRRPCHRDGNRRSNPCWDRGAARRAGPHHSGRRSWRS
jgi:hypothetical protein